jgi:hypothetical protein
MGHSMHACSAALPTACAFLLVSSTVRLLSPFLAVPNVYPVDLFEHIWAVDRLERLGISRYFQKEIEQCMDYVNRWFIFFFLQPFAKLLVLSTELTYIA